MRATSPIESAARALCKADGHPENIRFEGAEMWRRYAPQARAVFEAIRGCPPAGVDTDTWRAMIDAAIAEAATREAYERG